MFFNFSNAKKNTSITSFMPILANATTTMSKIICGRISMVHSEGLTVGMLKILFYRELKLVDENLFKGIQFILLVEDKPYPQRQYHHAGHLLQ